MDAAERVGSKSFETCFGRQDRVWNLRRIPDARRTDFGSGADGTRRNDPRNGAASDFYDISAGEEKNAYRGTFSNLNGMFSPLNGVEIEGYEIHMGKTIRLHGASPILNLTTEEEERSVPAAYVDVISMGFLTGRK